MPHPSALKRHFSLLLVASAALLAVAVACSGGDGEPPTPAPTPLPTGPTSADEAIADVRAYLGQKTFEGEFNCLETLETDSETTWIATQPTDDRWAVTLRVAPARLLFNVHSWIIFTRDGRVEAPRQPC